MWSLLTGFEVIYNDWNSPWQFHLSLISRKVVFGRHSYSPDDRNKWYFLESGVKVSLNIWTHVAVTWDHATGNSTIYVNGKNEAYSTYPPGVFFYPPTGKPYKIGNDGHLDDHQFYGSVMDLYVFGTALSLDQINKLRGWCLIPLHKHKSVVTFSFFVVA